MDKRGISRILRRTNTADLLDDGIENGSDLMSRAIAVVGSVLLVAAIAFFFYMPALAFIADDPATMMGTAGAVARAIGSLGVALIVAGLIGNKV